MIFTVYTRPDGAYLLIPDCLHVPRAAEVAHGPLQYCETVDSEEHAMPALWERVMAEVDQMSFAILQAAVGRQMLGLDCEISRLRADPGFAGAQPA